MDVDRDSHVDTKTDIRAHTCTPVCTVCCGHRYRYRVDVRRHRRGGFHQCMHTGMYVPVQTTTWVRTEVRAGTDLCVETYGV